jgi:hypothetical protein
MKPKATGSPVAFARTCGIVERDVTVRLRFAEDYPALMRDSRTRFQRLFCMHCHFDHLHCAG